jgi:DNA (cytosine-5)-methyltransferase 1
VNQPHKVISLFSGAGGLDIGFEAAGFEIAVMVEADPSCCDTLRKNLPKVPLLEGPIEGFTTERILQAASLGVGEAALVIGGPPCQPFSLAGNRHGLDDPRGHLLKEFVRVVREALPLGFVMENVRGLMNWDGGRAAKLVLDELRTPISHSFGTITYAIPTPQVLNAAEFGVPQFRERVFFVGNRGGVAYRYPTPTHGDDEQLATVPLSPYRTAWEAIGHLPSPAEPSETAQRVSRTIKARIEKHGY